MVRRLAWCKSSNAQPVGASPSGKAPDFDSGIRRFDPFRPSQPTLLRSFGWLTPLKISDAAGQRRLSAPAPKERRRTHRQRVRMHYVYLMQSKCNSSQRYVGYTSDLRNAFGRTMPAPQFTQGSMRLGKLSPILPLMQSAKLGNLSSILNLDRDVLLRTSGFGKAPRKTRSALSGSKANRPTRRTRFDDAHDAFGIKSEMTVEICNGSGLAEVIDAQAVNPMTGDTAEPAQSRRMPIDDRHDDRVTRHRSQQFLHLRRMGKPPVVAMVLAPSPLCIETVGRRDREHAHTLAIFCHEPRGGDRFRAHGALIGQNNPRT